MIDRGFDAVASFADVFAVAVYIAETRGLALTLFAHSFPPTIKIGEANGRLLADGVATTGLPPWAFTVFLAFASWGGSLATALFA